MDLPPPGVVSDSGPYPDQTLDQPVDGTFRFFTSYRELADQVWEVVGQNPIFNLDSWPRSVFELLVLTICFYGTIPWA